MTSWRDCLAAVGLEFAASPFVAAPCVAAGPKRAVLLKIHWTVVSRSVMNGSVVTSRSNQKWTPVMGESLILSRLWKAALDCAISDGRSSAKVSGGKGKTWASADSSRLLTKQTDATELFSILMARTGERRATSPPTFSMKARQP